MLIESFYVKKLVERCRDSLRAWEMPLEFSIDICFKDNGTGERKICLLQSADCHSQCTCSLSALKKCFHQAGRKKCCEFEKKTVKGKVAIAQWGFTGRPGESSRSNRHLDTS